MCQLNVYLAATLLFLFDVIAWKLIFFNFAQTTTTGLFALIFEAVEDLYRKMQIPATLTTTNQIASFRHQNFILIEVVNKIEYRIILWL